MKVKFFTVIASDVDEMEEKLNDFLGKVDVVQIFQTSATYDSVPTIGENNLLDITGPKIRSTRNSHLSFLYWEK